MEVGWLFEFLNKVFYDSQVILLAPLRDFSVLWTLIPIYLSWLQAEFFFERDGLTYGNAFANGFSMVWCCVNWLRYLFLAGIDFDLLNPKYVLSIVFMLYGLVVIIESFLGKSVVKLLGRRSEITFVAVLLTPYVYDLVVLDFSMVISLIISYSFLLLVIFVLKHVLPKPRGVELDESG